MKSLKDRFASNETTLVVKETYEDKRPCDLCCPNKPKYNVGYKLIFEDGVTFFIGKNCGKKHLGDNFIVMANSADIESEKISLLEQVENFLLEKDNIINTARNSFNDKGLLFAMDTIKQINMLNPNAAKSLTNSKNRDAALFNNPHFIVLASEVISAFKDINSINHDTDIRKLRTFVRTLQSRIRAYNDGCEKIKKFQPKITRAINSWNDIMEDSNVYFAKLKGNLHIFGSNQRNYNASGFVKPTMQKIILIKKTSTNKQTT